MWEASDCAHVSFYFRMTVAISFFPRYAAGLLANVLISGKMLFLSMLPIWQSSKIFSNWNISLPVVVCLSAENVHHLFSVGSRNLVGITIPAKVISTLPQSL